MDELRLVTTWDSRCAAKTVDTVWVAGLQLQGAIFDGMRLSPVTKVRGYAC